MKVPELNENEFALLKAYHDGKDPEEVAEHLNVTARTLERYWKSISWKFSIIDGRLGGNMGSTARYNIIQKIFRDYYLNEVKQDDRPIFYVHRKNVVYRMQIEQDYIRVITQVEIINITPEPLKYVTHGLLLDDRTPEADASHLELDAYIINTPLVKNRSQIKAILEKISSEETQIKATAQEVQIDPKKPRFRVDFDPPLDRGKGLVYEYNLKSMNYYPMSKAEIRRRITEGFYHLQEEVCELSYTISTETGHLKVEITFPVLFEIENAFVKVEVGQYGPPSLEEEQRANEALTIQQFNKRLTLSLDLEKPIVNHRYRIRWIPAI